MIRRYFSAGEAARLAEVSYRRLDLWCRRGIIRPSKRAAGGKGHRRLFTFRDVVEARTLRVLTEQGVRLAALVACVEQLRDALRNAGEESLATTRLVTDGRAVFRYIPEKDHLESLDGYGQFAFAFGIGEQISLLTLSVERLDRRSRYTRRPKRAANA